MKKIFLVMFLFTFILISGCKANNTETESAELSSQISSSVLDSQITEPETKSNIAKESSSELNATVAQNSEINSNVSPKSDVPQSREVKSESSAVENKLSAGNEKANSDSTLSGSSGNAIKNATAADTREIADKVIGYLNKARAEKGSGELSKLSGLTRYAEYRSGQLISHFAHDPNDWNKAAEATGYGKYIDLSESGGTAQGYYDIGAREALAMAGLAGSTDQIAETLAQIIIDSPRHWSYVGSKDMTYCAVGVSSDTDMWYAAILVTNTDEYEN